MRHYTYSNVQNIWRKFVENSKYSKAVYADILRCYMPMHFAIAAYHYILHCL